MINIQFVRIAKSQILSLSVYIYKEDNDERICLFSLHTTFTQSSHSSNNQDTYSIYLLERHISDSIPYHATHLCLLHININININTTITQDTST